jgi:hypothetical protein
MLDFTTYEEECLNKTNTDWPPLPPYYGDANARNLKYFTAPLPASWEANSNARRFCDDFDYTSERWQRMALFYFLFFVCLFGFIMWAIVSHSLLELKFLAGVSYLKKEYELGTGPLSEIFERFYLYAAPDLLRLNKTAEHQRFTSLTLQWTCGTKDTVDRSLGEVHSRLAHPATFTMPDGRLVLTVSEVGRGESVDMSMVRRTKGQS